MNLIEIDENFKCVWDLIIGREELWNNVKEDKKTQEKLLRISKIF